MSDTYIRYSSRRSFFHPIGAKAKTYDLLRQLVPLFERVSQEGKERWIMGTLTLDPKRFEGPSEAFDYVTGGRHVSRSINQMLREMGLDPRGRWMYKFECQKNGNPHWHFLMRVPCQYIVKTKNSEPKKRFRLKRSVFPMTRLFEIWGLGGVDITCLYGKPGAGARYVAKAVGYISKEASWPEWVMDRPNESMHATESSNGFYSHLLPPPASAGEPGGLGGLAAKPPKSNRYKAECQAYGATETVAQANARAEGTVELRSSDGATVILHDVKKHECQIFMSYLNHRKMGEVRGADWYKTDVHVSQLGKELVMMRKAWREYEKTQGLGEGSRPAGAGAPILDTDYKTVRQYIEPLTSGQGELYPKSIDRYRYD